MNRQSNSQKQFKVQNYISSSCKEQKMYARKFSMKISYLLKKILLRQCMSSKLSIISHGSNLRVKGKK
ncbi:hypothetical protein FGO68_gene9187 [Halteria grandinella]|uniref:Uncharacterized protein n=1 Tax=Halteria grandinella TaxID=5974 RepID=A0A8J8NIR8_HALGN|nr:hypothetical protein FGO68_gene9187 [Halteria grandinella]